VCLFSYETDFKQGEGPDGSMIRSLDLTAHTSISPIRRGFAPSFVNYKKGALDSQPPMIKFTFACPGCAVLRLPPPLKLVGML
jgi:hypothetical protein